MRQIFDLMNKITIFVAKSSTMKTYIFHIITILITAAVFGCHSKSTVYKELELVDTLLQCDQDTAAYHVLNAITELNDEECQAYYFLLRTQTDYKLYREIISDSLINIAVEYYTKHSNDKDKLGNALHYQSVINYDLGDTDKAILLAKEAEYIAEYIKNYALQYKVYLLLAVFNNASHDNVLAVEYTYKQLKAAQNAHNEKWVAYAKLNLASLYLQLAKSDSLQYYITQVRESLVHLDKISQAYYYYCLGNIASDTATMVQYYDSSAQCNPLPHVLAAQAALIKDDTSKISRLCAQILASQAWPETKINALEVMSDIYCSRNDVHKLKEVEDSIKSEMWKMNQNILTDKTVEKQQRYNMEKAELKYHQFIITIMLSSVIVLFVCIVIYLRKKLKTKQYETEISNQAIAISNLKGNIIYAQNRMQELEAINQQLEDRLSKGGSISEIERGKLAVQMENSQKELAETQNQLSELNAQLDKYMKIFANGRNLYESIKRGGNAATWTDDDYTDYYYYALLENDIDLSEYDDLTPLQKFTVIQLKMTDNYATVANMLGISESSLRTSVNRIEKKRKKRS